MAALILGSSSSQAAGGLIGATIGFFIGGPYGAQIGFAIGSSAGAAHGPAQKAYGPRLGDLKTATSSYGSVIPFVEGHPRLGGVIVWNSDKREIVTTTESGGKGGPSVETETYTYECDVMYMLSENEIAGVRRIWSNGELIWTVGNDADAESIVASGGPTGLAGAQQGKFVSGQSAKWRGLRVYTGAADQLPDPTYEAAKGVGNAPAYRGRGTLVIEGLNLGNGGQMPNLTFEVVTEATLSYATGSSWSVVGPTGGGGVEYSGTASFDPQGYHIHIPQWDAGYSNGMVDVYRVQVGSNEARFALRIDTGFAAGTAIVGVSDVSVMCIHDASAPSAMAQYDGDGTLTVFNNPIANAMNRFARRDDLVVFSSQASGLQKVWAFSTGGGAYDEESVALGQSIQSLAIGARVYALSADQTTIWALNLVTLALEATIATPGAPSGGSEWLVCDDEDALYLLKGSTLYRYDGAAWAAHFSGLPSGLTATETGVINIGFVAGTFNAVTREGGFPPLTHRHYYAVSTLAASDIPLDEVVERQCERAGLDLAHVDASDLSSLSVRAMAVSQAASPREVIDILAAAYLFESVESDVLKFVRRGGAPVATLPYAALGAAANESSADPLTLTRTNDIELPARIAVRFANVDDDYQDGNEHSDRMITGSSTVQTVEIPLGFTPQEAKRLADARIMDVAASVTRLGPIHLDREYSRLEPTDVVLLTGRDGSTYRARLLKQRQADGVISFEGVLDDASAVSSSVLTSGGYNSTTLVRMAKATSFELLDIPILRDADNSSGIYIAAKGEGTPWLGATIYRSTDDINFTPIGTITDAAVFGLATTALSDWTGGGVVDEMNTVTVDVDDGTLASSTREAMLADPTINTLLLGAEVIRFVSATLVSAGVYTLSRLFRGQRGTEWATGTHAIGEGCVLLRPTGMRRLQDQTSDIGQPRFYKVVSFGQLFAGVNSVPFTDNGVALKPFAPVDARGGRDSSGNAVISWKRRTRVAVRFTGAAGINTPLGEATESYAVEIYEDDTFATLLRTLSATEEEATYTAEMAIEDFGTAQRHLSVRIFQISEAVGRGYVLEATVDCGEAQALPVVVVTGTGAAGGVTSNIDLRTGGALIEKGLTTVGEPNGSFFTIGTTTVDMNTSSSSGAVASSGVTIGALGITYTTGSSLARSGRRSLLAFLPKLADLFERVSWTGNGGGARAIPHAIGRAPALAFVRRRDAAGSWLMYSSQAGANQSLAFPSAAGAQFVADADSFPTLATATDFNVGTTLNANGAFWEAYLFSGDSTLVDEGTYTGNGSASGPAVGVGFSPRLLIIRPLGGTNRFTFMTSDQLAGTGYTHWFVDDQGAAAATAAMVTLDGSGFTVASADGAVNETGATYQYLAFRPWS